MPTEIPWGSVFRAATTHSSPKRAVPLALTVSIAFDLRSQTEHSKHVLESASQQNHSRHKAPFASSSKAGRGLDWLSRVEPGSSDRHDIVN